MRIITLRNEVTEDRKTLEIIEHIISEMKTKIKGTEVWINTTENAWRGRGDFLNKKEMKGDINAIRENMKNIKYTKEI